MKSGTERRRFKRRPVLDSFSLFAVIPKKGGHRLTVYDLSDEGLLFDLDTEGEAASDYPLQSGEELELHLYLNQSLYLPLKLKVVRISEENSIRRIGAEIKDKGSKAYKAFQAFLQMLDVVHDEGRLTSES